MVWFQEEVEEGSQRMLESQAHSLVEEVGEKEMRRYDAQGLRCKHFGCGCQLRKGRLATVMLQEQQST